MLITLILLLIGLATIVIEFFMPGGVVGILGGGILFASVVSFATETQSLLWTLGYIIFLAIALFYSVKFAMWRVKHGTFKNSIYLDKDQEGYVASHWDKSLIGKEGVVTSDLKPGGHIMVEGKKQQALSQSGYLIKGDFVVVVGGEGETLIVKKKI